MNILANSYAGKILWVDLSRNEFVSKPLDVNFAKKFFGGKGFGAKLLYDLLEPRIDPLHPEDALIFCTGPLTATLMPTNRYCIVTKSPLTGLFSDSYAGGYFSQELKYAGYDVMVIQGKANKPVYLLINDENIEVKPADHIWGLDTYQVYDVLRKEIGDKAVKIACIGPAGEKMVRFALVDSYYHRHAGRCGTGAVMGSKNLKAIAVLGSGEVSVADPKAFDKAVWTAYDEIRSSSSCQQYTKGGTASVVEFANTEGFFPALNFQDGFFEKYRNFDNISQEKNLWLREYGCFACPIHCTKVGMIRKGPYKGQVCDIIEYETTGLLGGSCNVENLEALAYANLLCDRLGLDTMSTGCIIGFAMECYEKGIIDKKDTGGLELKFGNWEAQIELVKRIAYREGIGDLLAEGVKMASQRIGKGADDLAVHMKGMEAPAWGPRGSPAMGLALATSDRGCDHEKAWPIAYELGSAWPFGEPYERLTTEGKERVVKWEQDHLAALYSLVVCDMSRGGISNDTYLRLLSSAVSWDIDYTKFLETGERIWNIIRMFNVREGIGRKEDASLPKRFKQPLPSGPAKGHAFNDVEFNKMLDEYYALRGWDKNGKPTKEKLVELEISDLASM